MVLLNVKIEGLDILKTPAIEKAVMAATVRTIKAVAITSNKEIKKAVKDRYNVKGPRITKAFKLNQAKLSRPVSEIVITGKPPGLQNYATKAALEKGLQRSGKKRKTSHIKVKVLKAGGTKTVKGKNVFVGRPRGQGKPQIWERLESGKLKRLIGPSIPQMVSKVNGEKIIETTVNAKAQIVFDRELKFQIDKKLKG